MEEEREYLYSSDKKRRAVLFLDSSGSVRSTAEYWYRNELADIEGWAPLPGDASYYIDFDAARREARFKFDFLRDSVGEE